jgi:hypothetical protein
MAASSIVQTMDQTEFGGNARMNALLLYPEFPDTFWSFKHALKFIRKRASLPPLGLLTIAAMLPASWAFGKASKEGICPVGDAGLRFCHPFPDICWTRFSA